MSNKQFCRRHVHTRERRGVATLEFVLAMPTLLLLMVGIVWLGYSVVYQAEVNTESRHEAWKKRFDNSDANPLIFPTFFSYSAETDHASATASKEVNVSPVFESVASPEASQTVLANTWDHRVMQLTDFPN